MKTFCFAVVCAAVATLGTSALAETKKEAATLNQISGYRAWTRVNPNPVEVTVPVTRTASAISLDPAAMG